MHAEKPMKRGRGDEAPAPLSPPPRRRPPRPARLSRSTLTSGRDGTGTLAVGIGTLLVALLVGWVLLWATRPGGPNVALLTVGVVGFALVLIFLAGAVARLRAERRLRRAEALVLTGLGHSLRTPIAGMRAAAQALAHPELDATSRRELLDAIVGESRRLERRVENALETGRLAVEGAVSAREPVEIEALLERLAEEAAPAVQAASGRLTVHGGGPIRVRGGERALALAFENLIDNALKYAEGPPAVDLWVSAEGGRHLRVAVLDVGRGFDAPPDGRWSFERATNGDGLGLGLTVARAIVRAHGGELTLHSAGRGRGATAEVWLPLAAGERPE